jgi:hypothetical protein
VINLFPHLGAETSLALEGFLHLIDRTFPLPRRYAGRTPRDIAELSRLFTSAQGERTETYLGKPGILSAYLRYFLPWNLYRLCRLLPGLSLPFEDGGAITDLGSGPLTLALALWISRPDLRSLRLEFRCIDRTAAVMRAGEKLFKALTGGECPWIIRLEKGSLERKDLPRGTDRPGVDKPPVRLAAAVNVFTELALNTAGRDGGRSRQFVEKSFKTLAAYSMEGGYILAVEPGNPQGGAFITGLRNALIESGGAVLAPCPHIQTCPFPSGKTILRGAGRTLGKGKWCHFTFDTEEAPAALRKLSAQAGLPKERAVLSFLLARLGGQGQSVQACQTGTDLRLRVISDAFPLPAAAADTRDTLFGRYCCSEQGMVLLTGKKSALEKAAPGALLEAACKGNRRDPKTGALIAEI